MSGVQNMSAIPVPVMQQYGYGIQKQAPNSPPKNKAQPKVEKPLIETPNMPSLYPSMSIIEETGILIKNLPEEYRDSESFNRLIANLGQFTGCSILEDDGSFFGIANFADGANAQRAISTLASAYHLEAGLSKMASDFIQKQGPARRRTLFVGGIGTALDEEDFETFFQEFGEIESCGIKRDKETGISKGMGFVCFKDIKSAEACRNASGKRELKGTRPFFTYFRGPMPNPSQYSHRKADEASASSHAGDDDDLKMPTPESLDSKFIPHVEYDENGNPIGYEGDSKD
jgi:RNA recognition motif-containing protein